MGKTLSKYGEKYLEKEGDKKFKDLDLPTKGYPGSGPTKPPSAKNPPGIKNYDIWVRVGVAKIPEISTVVLYECLDTLKNDGSYRFSGIEVMWTDRVNGQRIRGEKLFGEKTAWRVREINALDYIKKINFCTTSHEGVEYISYCGIEPNIAEPAGAGQLQTGVQTITAPNSEHVEGVQSFRLRYHPKLKVITGVEVFWARVSDDKANADKGGLTSFFNGNNDVTDDGKKIYEYKIPENKYEDFSSLIKTGKIHDEYLGGLPIRFLSPEELNRYQNLVSTLQLEPLIHFLKTKGNIHHVKLEPAIEEKVVNFVVKVLLEELFKKPYFPNKIQVNIRFALKMLCIVFSDDEGLWKKITGKLKAEYERIAATLFDEPMDEILKDPKLADMQKIENMEDAAVKEKYQKACPSNPDKGGEQDVEKLAKSYCLDAAQFLQEFHATFRSIFRDNYHGAPVKGLDRIKAKCQEYADEKKLNASDSVARIMDFLRGTVECKNGKEVCEAFEKISKIKGNYKIVRVKNGFKDTKPGFKSILLNIMVYDSLICEVQITFESMKTNNDLNHFLYEVLREHSLYDMVSKNLNLNIAFKEWLDPLAPQYSKVIFPRNQMFKWKGFTIEDATTSIYNLGKTKRDYFVMNTIIDRYGKITGNGCDRIGDYKVEGQLDLPSKSIEWKMTPNFRPMQGGMYGAPPAANSEPPFWYEFKATFLDKSMAEGVYLTKKPKSSGSGGAFGWLDKLAPDSKRFFRIWVDDEQLSGLNPGLMAFKDLNKDSRVIRKKYLPHRAMKWTGVMGGALKGKDLRLDLNLKIENPHYTWNLKGTQGISGNGRGLSKVSGHHNNYDTLIVQGFLGSNSKSCLPPNPKYAKLITVSGFFLEDLKIGGIYDNNGDMGRFTLECQDPKALKEYAPKEEALDDRWELLTTSHDGKRQYSQLNLKATNGGVAGSGINNEGKFQVQGKQTNKVITFTKDQNNEKLEFDGQYITKEIWEGFYRSPTSYGRFRLMHA